MFFQHIAISTRRASTAEQEIRFPLLPTVVEPYYRSSITIDRVALHDVPMSFHVTPGMPVATDIEVGVTARYSVISSARWSRSAVSHCASRHTRALAQLNQD